MNFIIKEEHSEAVFEQVCPPPSAMQGQVVFVLRIFNIYACCSFPSFPFISFPSQGSFRGALSPTPQKASATSPRKRGAENAVVHFFRTIVSNA